jgi:pimeloyl-ACP methyl ester carboxylesterase
MIASLTRSIILLQMLALVALAALVVHLQWLAWPGALLGSAAWLMLVRIAILFNNYLLSGVLRQPLTNGRPAPKLQLFIRIAQECWCSLRCWFHLFPSARTCRIRYENDARPPVLMLHGYGANSGYWKPFATLLAQDRISHAAIDLEPILADIDDYAKHIEHEVANLLMATGASQVILLCHSMGGLAARAWIRRYGPTRVARVITLGTPHFGSTLAGYGMGRNAMQMQNNGGEPSAWLAQLAASETDEVRALFVSISTQHDNIVAPQSSAILPGANNRMVNLIGHVALGFDQAMNRQTLDLIHVARGAGQARRDAIEL